MTHNDKFSNRTTESSPLHSQYEFDSISLTLIDFICPLSVSMSLIQFKPNRLISHHQKHRWLTDQWDSKYMYETIHDRNLNCCCCCCCCPHANRSIWVESCPMMWNYYAIACPRRITTIHNGNLNRWARFIALIRFMVRTDIATLLCEWQTAFLRTARVMYRCD